MINFEEFETLLDVYFGVEHIPAARKNYGRRRGGMAPDWVVVHYTGTAAPGRNIARFFQSEHRAPRSTHYLVDGENVLRCVPLARSSWHVGGRSASKKIPVENSNSFGVDLCEKKADKTRLSIKDHDWYIDAETQRTGAALVAMLCRSFDIPIDHVVRHFDVTGKKCPYPMTGAKNFPLMPVMPKTGMRPATGEDAWQGFLFEVEKNINSMSEFWDSRRDFFKRAKV